MSFFLDLGYIAALIMWRVCSAVEFNKLAMLLTILSKSLLLDNWQTAYLPSERSSCEEAIKIPNKQSSLGHFTNALLQGCHETGEET